MKMFDLKGAVLGLNKPSIVSLLNSIELYKGKTLPVNKVKKLDVLKEIVNDKMVNALPLNIPVVVELNTGTNWLEAH